MDFEEINALAAEIVGGVSKGSSRLRREPGFDDEWDGLVVDIDAIGSMHDPHADPPTPLPCRPVDRKD